MTVTRDNKICLYPEEAKKYKIRINENKRQETC